GRAATTAAGRGRRYLLPSAPRRWRPRPAARRGRRTGGLLSSLEPGPRHHAGPPAGRGPDMRRARRDRRQPAPPNLAAGAGRRAWGRGRSSPPGWVPPGPPPTARIRGPPRTGPY